MGNYILLFALAALLSIATVLHSSRTSTLKSERRLADHTYKSIVAREAAITGLNLTLRQLAADTTRWTAHPSTYGYTRQPYRNATFTTTVLANHEAGPLLENCAVDTVDVVSTGYPDADSSVFHNHTIEATYVRTCTLGGHLKRDAESFTFDPFGILSNGGGGIDEESDAESSSETSNNPKGAGLVAYAEW